MCTFSGISGMPSFLVNSNDQRSNGRLLILLNQHMQPCSGHVPTKANLLLRRPTLDVLDSKSLLPMETLEVPRLNL